VKSWKTLDDSFGLSGRTACWPRRALQLKVRSWAQTFPYFFCDALFA
jgi:hypothetical protein